MYEAVPPSPLVFLTFHSSFPVMMPMLSRSPRKFRRTCSTWRRARVFCRRRSHVTHPLHCRRHVRFWRLHVLTRFAHVAHTHCFSWCRRSGCPRTCATTPSSMAFNRSFTRPLPGLDSFCSFLLDDVGHQPVVAASQLLTPFNVYNPHDK